MRVLVIPFGGDFLILSSVLRLDTLLSSIPSGNDPYSIRIQIVGIKRGRPPVLRCFHALKKCFHSQFYNRVMTRTGRQPKKGHAVSERPSPRVARGFAWGFARRRCGAPTPRRPNRLPSCGEWTPSSLPGGAWAARCRFTVPARARIMAVATNFTTISRSPSEASLSERNIVFLYALYSVYVVRSELYFAYFGALAIVSRILVTTTNELLIYTISQVVAARYHTKSQANLIQRKFTFDSTHLWMTRCPRIHQCQHPGRYKTDSFTF